MGADGKRLRVVAAGLAAFAVAVLAAQAIEDRSASVRADYRNAALAAVQGGRYAEAIPGLREMADAGNVQAIALLARLYASGLGVPRDVVRATTLYQEALAAGLDEVRVPLARLLEARAHASAERQPELEARAAALYRAAADAGDVDAMVWLGEALLRGGPLEAEPLAGSRWLLRAADAGSARARMRVGELHREGFGFPQDPVVAHAWLNLAAASFPLDEPERDRAIQARDDLSRTLRRDQLDRALDIARELFASAT